MPALTAESCPALHPWPWGKPHEAAVQRLRELGWIEDRTVAIEIRWAEGRNERYTEIAAELASQRHNQSRAHDEQKCWIPRARDVEEALDHGGIGKARQAQPEPEDEAGDQADKNLAHVPPLLRSHAA